MDAGFIDLDILLTRIRNEQSKVYFLDAVKAYKAGALRASLTSAWVALVYDLIAKYRELSVMGDAAATTYITSWDAATATNDVKKLLQLEAGILEDATANTQVVNWHSPDTPGAPSRGPTPLRPSRILGGSSVVRAITRTGAASPCQCCRPRPGAGTLAGQSDLRPL